MSPSGSHSHSDRVIDHMDIHAVICSYLRDVDERRFDRIPAYFTTDAQFIQYVSIEARNARQPISVAKGHAEILDQFNRFFRLLDRTHHSISNFFVQPHDDHTDVFAHMRCYHRGTGASSGLWEESLSLLQAIVVRADAGWRIRSFDYTVSIVLGSPSVFGDPAISALESGAAVTRN
jgi:SnoaL-like domain